jgi:hypothetical protein
VLWPSRGRRRRLNRRVPHLLLCMIDHSFQIIGTSSLFLSVCAWHFF